MSKQHFLMKLLNGAEVEWLPLGEIAVLRRGRVMSKEYLMENVGEYPVYSSQTARNGTIGSIDTFDFDGEFVSWTTDGANAGTVFYRTGKFSITNVCGVIKSNGQSLLSHKFLYYWLSIEAQRHVSSGMGNPKLMSHQVRSPSRALTIPRSRLRFRARSFAFWTPIPSLLPAKNNTTTIWTNCSLLMMMTMWNGSRWENLEN